MVRELFEKTMKMVMYYPHLGDGYKGALSVSRKPKEDKNETEYEYDLLINGGCILDLTGDLYLGKKVYIGRGAKIWTHTHDIKSEEVLLDRQERLGKAFTIPMNKVILEDVWIYESTILPGCRLIARGVVIGAGSVVTKSIIEPLSIWGGNPARRIGSRLEKDMCYESLEIRENIKLDTEIKEKIQEGEKK
jgi:putative colanic acid biosynthesis acetyltransferase WcaF